MGKSKRPELCVYRAFTNERPMLDIFAEAYKAYFDEKKRLKSSVHTFDSDKSVHYNYTNEESKEVKKDGSAA